MRSGLRQAKTRHPCEDLVIPSTCAQAMIPDRVGLDNSMQLSVAMEKSPVMAR
jgi:hypothetical protein